VGELAKEFWRVRRQVDVQEAMGLLGGDVVEALQGLHGIGRTNFLEEALEFLLGSKAPYAVELSLGSDYGGDRSQLLRTDPARNVLMPTPSEQGVQYVLALVMQYSWVITEIIYDQNYVKQFLVPFFSLHR
jgi:hypothetical protein